jgi:hypothetical protein
MKKDPELVAFNNASKVRANIVYDGLWEFSSFFGAVC